MKPAVFFSRILFLFALVPVLQGQDQWGQLRGPHQGVSPTAANLPVSFGPEQNVIWKTPLGNGHSSPVVWGDRIFVTSETNNELETCCIDRTTGAILWRRSAWYEFIERVHKVNSPATPTPATDGERVYVYLGSSGLICYDYDGNEVWSRVMRTPANMYGTATSLVMGGDYLIHQNDNAQQSYLEAIDPATGETVWRADRKDFKASWSTPMVWNHDGVDEVVVYGVWWLKAYDLRDGAERWSFPGLTDEPIIMPVHGNGLVYLTSYNMKTNPEVIGLPDWKDLVSGYDTDGDGELSLQEAKANRSILSRYDADGEGDHPLWGFHRFLDADRSGTINEAEWGRMIEYINSFEQVNALLAIKPATEKTGETTVVWKYEKGVPEAPSPLLYKDRIYMVKNGGMVTCLDAGTGRLVYEDRLGAGGPYYASPVAGDGKIYAASRRGDVTVFEAGDLFRVLGGNQLGERIMATPAIVGNTLYIRTENHLFAFAQQ
ncbi:PQQ-binding-like beta-propeller repeat protein [bacterium]|nr:PQQ-binding-like beta-propeller repeat protein [bacterium]